MSEVDGAGDECRAAESEGVAGAAAGNLDERTGRYEFGLVVGLGRPIARLGRNLMTVDLQYRRGLGGVFSDSEGDNFAFQGWTVSLGAGR